MGDDLEYSDTSVYDEVHGYINLTQEELSVIDTPLFQRLNHIKQLGMAYRVFPGAQHTRFSHSLGVLHIMDRMARRLKIDIEDRKKLRLAALLHDIGHYPFSHCVEVVMTNHGRNEDAKHEAFSAHLIRESSLKDRLPNFSKNDLSEVADIVQGRSGTPLHNQMMSSELDADRLEYLIRDSLNTGVAYGRIDIERILHTLALDNEGFLCVNEDGLHAAEGYIIGRYLMWATTYTHRAIAGFDELVQHAYPLQVEPKYCSIEELKRLSEEELVLFNDSYILTKIYSGCSKTDEPYLKELCDMFVSRTHLDMVAEGQVLSRDPAAEKHYHRLDSYSVSHQVKTLSEISKVPVDWIFHNNSETQMPTLKPFVEKYTVRDNSHEREWQRLLRIRGKDGNSIPLVSDPRSIVSSLQDLSLDIVRIFTKTKYEDQLRRGIEEHWKGAS